MTDQPDPADPSELVNSLRHPLALAAFFWNWRLAVHILCIDGDE